MGLMDERSWEKILSLSQSQARRLAIAKSTLYYLRKNAGSCRSFRVCGKVREKLEAATGSLDGLELCFLDDYVASVIFYESDDVAYFGLQLSADLLCERDPEAWLNTAVGDDLVHEALKE